MGAVGLGATGMHAYLNAAIASSLSPISNGSLGVLVVVLRIKTQGHIRALFLDLTI